MIDQRTYDLITNPTILDINYFSSNNMEVGEHLTYYFISTNKFVWLLSYNLFSFTVSLYHKYEDLYEWRPQSSQENDK